MTDESFPTLDEVKRAHALDALYRCGGRRHVAAAMLGVSFKTIYNWLREWLETGLITEEEYRHGRPGVRPLPEVRGGAVVPRAGGGAGAEEAGAAAVPAVRGGPGAGAGGGAAEGAGAAAGAGVPALRGERGVPGARAVQPVQPGRVGAGAVPHALEVAAGGECAGAAGEPAG
jgi:hypothetical protein